MAEENFGFILIDKPIGMTSHDAVNRLRRLTGVRKIGHAGTLDPGASGLLLLAIGRPATREIGRFVGLDKEYSAVVRLGAATDTYDREGRIVKEYKGKEVGRKTVAVALKNFIGYIDQVPPMFSAKKIGGRKLYELARRGQEIARPPSRVKIYKIKITRYRWPDLRLAIKCSSGTYIRSLAHDLGEVLGCGAYLEELRRTAIGRYKARGAARLGGLTAENWRPKLFQVRARRSGAKE